MRKNRYIMFLLLIIMIFASNLDGASACSVITSSSDGVWFGYNEDRPLFTFDQNTYIRFHENTSETYAFMEVTWESPEIFSLKVGINEFGVAISGNGLSGTEMNPHPEKEFSWKSHSFYRLVLQYARNITDVLEIIDKFEFEPVMAFQVHIADAIGNAIVVSPGDDGEIAITPISDELLISTNTNAIDIDDGAIDTRYTTAVDAMGEAYVNSKERMKNALDMVHGESYEGYTYYSTIFDLENRMAYFYLMHDFDVEIEFDIDDELAMGDHFYVLSDLFPDGAEIIDDAETRLQTQEIITLIFRILSVICSLIVIYLLIRRFKEMRNTGVKNGLSIHIWIFSQYIFYALFLYINISVLPVIVMTNILQRSIESGVMDLAIIVILSSWVIFLGIWIFKFIIKRKNMIPESSSEVDEV